MWARSSRSHFSPRRALQHDAGIELKADPRDEFDLGFQKVDLLFLIVNKPYYAS